MLDNLEPNKKKAIIIGVSVLALVIVGYFLYKRRKNKAKEEDPIDKAIRDAQNNSSDSDEKVKTEAELIAEVEADTSFPLRVGKEGLRVSQLQDYIVKEKDASLLSQYGVDGRFGNETLSAVMSSFNRDNISKGFFIDRKMYNYGKK